MLEIFTDIPEGLVTVAYIAASILFILALGGLSHPETARRGNLYGIIGMLIALLAATLGVTDNFELLLVALIIGSSIGLWLAKKVQMTQMPELVAILHSLVGLAAVLVGFANSLNPNNYFSGIELTIHDIETYIGILIGAITFSGSVIAFGKLSGLISGNPLILPARHWLNLALLLVVIWYGRIFVLESASGGDALTPLIVMTVLSLLFGIHMVMAIGGADMPVVVSLLNSLSGIAAAFTGFIIGNNVLIIAGSMVGAAGLILTNIMCKAMNRQLIDVLFKSFGGSDKEQVTRTKVGSDPEEVAMVCDGISKCVIIPGYGMAVSQCQHQVREFADILEANGCEVKYGIHPVAGRMPGHMNVLLAEASVPYEKLIEMDDINSEMGECDVAVVVGANDTVNPAARSGEGPLAGMPIIDADKARVVVMVKRSLSVGYAGVDNDLFYEDKTMMLFGDGKKMMTDLVSSMKDL